MKYSEIPPLYRATWSVYEALRRLGFGDDDVTFVAGPTTQVQATCLHVVLTTQGKSFTVTVGELDRPLAEARDLLEKLRLSVRDRSTPDEVLLRIWRESEMGDIGYYTDFCGALVARGFVLPAVTN
ncbi:MAG: hypothetical protein FJ144_28650 [Deltaproteobacteria bacterium]|nr:hypothetical protein [Deltaproteobacteria bacterium]